MKRGSGIPEQSARSIDVSAKPNSRATPDVTIVIPLYNRSKLVTHAIRSALVQSGINKEIIIVDDGSDAPYGIPFEFAAESSIRVVRLDVNAGPAAARNRGVLEARARWIAFLDSDDIWLPNTLGARLAEAERIVSQNPSQLFAFAAGYEIIRGEKHVKRVSLPAQSLIDFAKGCWFCPGSTLILQREIFSKIGGFDPLLRRLEDYEFFLRFGAASGKLIIFDEIVAVIHIERHTDPRTVEASARSIAQGQVALNLRQNNPDVLRLIQSYLALERSAANYFAGRLLACLKWLAVSLWWKPRTSLQIQKFWKDVRA